MKRFFYLFAAAAVLTAVTVSCKTEVSDVQLDKTELTLLRGETAILKATVLPADADNPAISWKSNNKSVAKVDNNGMVIAESVGTAVITVTTEEGGKTAKCTVTVTHPLDPEMILVEGGKFTMGCTGEQGEDCEEAEKPSHEVTLSSFKISKYLVTQELWAALMNGQKPSDNSGMENLPVERVSFAEVQEFISRLNDSTGRTYRLPTEAEWEYAARGGNKSQGYKYSGSNDLNEVAWHALNSGSRTQPVGGKKANELGIYDMSGNVEEWCSDWYDKNYYTAEPQTNPQGPSALGKQSRVTRGGYYNAIVSDCRVSYRRDTYSPPPPQEPTKSKFVGFRLVLVP
jgi:formylglycine-generating enzyme required for sulfatase activity